MTTDPEAGFEFAKGEKQEQPPIQLRSDYDQIVGTAWKLRSEGNDAAAEQLLTDNGIKSDNASTDAR